MDTKALRQKILDLAIRGKLVPQDPNDLKRRKYNLDLLELKFILFDKRISEDNENLNLLKQKYMLINKNLTMKELKQKLIRITIK